MKETKKQYLKFPFKHLEDISITFRNILGNSPEAGWFPRQVVPFSTGCGNPRLFLFPGVCPPALSLNPLLWFFLLVVAEVLKLSSFTESSFRRFCSLSSSGELPLSLTALLALWGPAGKVESSWERSSLLLSSPVYLEDHKIASLYLTWREDLPLSHMMRSIFGHSKVGPFEWRKGIRAHSHCDSFFFFLPCYFKDLFRTHKSYFYRF